MEGREAMAMTGPGSYYIHRISGPGSGTQSASGGVHGPQVVRPMISPNASLPLQSSTSPFLIESSSSVVSAHGVPMGGGQAGLGQGEPVKRKRGRPRKYGPEGNVSLALSPMASTPASGSSGIGVASVSGSGSGSGAPTEKRSRGRPPGTGRKQQLASLGEWISGSAGTGFTPHVITVAVGEDIQAKIMSFSQQGPRAVCILSANGSVSSVTLRQPSASGGTVTYEGRFEILSLSGSYLLTDEGGSRGRTGGLSITLSSPDSRVIGGGLGGSLVAASPIQVIVGSFIYGGNKARNKPKSSQESGVEPELAIGERQSTPTSTVANQNLNPSSGIGGWPGSRQLNMRSAHIDIDLTRG